MSLALIFAGQGAQKVGMGKSLYEGSAAAKALYDEANSVLGWDLKKISSEGPDTELTQTKICQPALFVHGLAVVAALREAGKLPAVKFTMGLSLGEVTALTAAGVFDFATGLKVVAERGRLMQAACEQTTGGMAAIIGEDRTKVYRVVSQNLTSKTANFNAPGQIVVSGEIDQSRPPAVAACQGRAA
jgi:[acyl-carrier-protein] S-malonyltransferase